MTTETDHAPSTRLGRIYGYLSEMFPPAVVIPSGVASFAAMYFALQILGGADALSIPWRAWFGAATVVLVMLLLRVYDELKDVETDLRLGRAGDPRYKHRAIVTGRIREDDLVALRWWVTGALLAINAPLGAVPLIGFLVLFFVTWLSYHWFFWPAVGNNLLLAFATHNPMTLLLVAYVVALYVQDFGAAGLSGGVVWLALAMWLPMAAWETSRKVRCPEDETEYQTYSKLLGWRVAGLLPAAFGVGGALCLIAVARMTALPGLYAVVVAGSACLLAGACVRFLLRPSSESANLKPFAEGFIFVSTVGLAAALVYTYGFGERGAADAIYIAIT